MPKTQISIKLDADLLDRIDLLAADIGSNRTAVIEQAIKNDLPEQEAFHKSLENPLVRAIHERITTPAILRAIATLAQDDLTDEQIARIVERSPAHREAAKKRKTERKTNSKAKRGGS